MASKLSRLGRLGSMSVGVSASYLGQRVAGLFQDEETRRQKLRDTHVANAERIVAQLGSLKGAAMKVGQAVAQVADGMNLPADARAVLGRLHDKVEPVPFETIRRRVEAELGGGLDTLFRSFDPEPLGTASLGQAHAATLPDGTSVVVKVLHEGVEHSVESDLGALKSMMVASKVLNRDRDEVEALFAELQERLAEELDYRQEAANLTEFRRYFQGNPDVVVPFVHEGWSTGKVLTMSRLPGRPLSVFVATASDAARARAGETLAHTFLQMEYVHRALHADPHPGNYLFTPDGRVGILDFGCVRRFDLEWMYHYGHVGYHTLHREREPAMEHAVACGALERRDPAAEDALWDLCSAISIPFRGGPFTVGGPEDTVQEEVMRILPRIVAQPLIRAPREMVYLHRGLGGTHQILKQLRATLDYRELFHQYAPVCFKDWERVHAAP